MKDREKQVVKTGIISILANLVLVGFKINEWDETLKGKENK